MRKSGLVTFTSPRGVIPQYLQAEIEARRAGAKFIEAEHMLLAIAREGDTPAGRALISAGLDHQRLVDALRDERQRSLAVAGVARPAAIPTDAIEPDRAISLGTSAKAALIRALHARREQCSHRRLQSADVLVGILGAELGTVPRALAIAGVDRAALIARAREGAEVSRQQC
ncbi:MAG: Clp protease N-terminal domain-containing protein [Candidatus Dormibacteraeota bacterium]|nr:Clp protease N-terminal domain-containing protein [Candidatus Dormibacteraeota bacterium]